ncbi:hypothetical protein [Amycolatopsis taiwanensis]
MRALDAPVSGGQHGAVEGSLGELRALHGA